MLKTIKIYTLILIVLSISYSQELSQLSFIETDGFVLSINATGNYAYISENGDSYSLFKSVDISDPRNPMVMDSLITTGFIMDFDINGSYAYLAMADAEFGLRILNISDPSQIDEVIFVEGTEANGIFYEDNFLYVADGGGLKVYDVSNPETLSFSWEYNSNTYGDGIRTFMANGFVYLTVHHTGLFIINNSTHELEGTISSPDVMLGLYYDRNNAFISDANLGFVAIDVNNPQNPFVIDSLSGIGGSILSSGIVVSGNTAYFADGSNGLKVVDISNPSQLELIDVFSPTNIFSYSVTVFDSLIYLGCDNGLYILTKESLSTIEDNSIHYPKDFSLLQNYPNPFNPITTIQYELPQKSNVQITIYDLLGREVKTLVNQNQDAGFKSVIWNATNGRGEPVSAGVYLYQIRAGALEQTMKMVLLK